MTKKQIEKLISESYREKDLDSKSIDQITNALDRNELKEYIKALKHWERSNSVIITLSHPPEENDKKKFLNLFPNKKIVYNIDPSLLVGLKIKNNDIISEYDLRDTLEDIVDYVSQV